MVGKRVVGKRGYTHDNEDKDVEDYEDYEDVENNNDVGTFSQALWVLR